jgi:hypothetical protein
MSMNISELIDQLAFKASPRALEPRIPSRTADANFQPISMLPLIGILIDGGLADGREIYASFREARLPPHVLDDDTVQRAIAYHTEGLEFVEIYEEQLRRWAAVPLTAKQAREVTRLQALIEPSRRLHRDGLALAQELARTIERVLEQSDEDLGLGATLSPRPPGGQPW